MAHKVLFSFLIATSINRNYGKIDEVLWGILLRGAGIMNKMNQPENPNMHIISSIGWDLAYFLELTFPEKFTRLTEHIIENLSDWEEFC